MAGRGEAGASYDGRSGAGRDNDGTKRGGDSVKSSKFPRVWILLEVNHIEKTPKLYLLPDYFLQTVTIAVIKINMYDGCLATTELYLSQIQTYGR